MVLDWRVALAGAFVPPPMMLAARCSVSMSRWSWAIWVCLALWSLPTQEDLEALYDESMRERSEGQAVDVHIRKEIRLTGLFVWSSGPPEGRGFAFTTGFGGTRQGSANRRALCVRDP